MVLWGQAGGRWVMEESSHRAWIWGFSPGPECSPDTLGAALPLCRVIPHPNPVLLEAACRALPHLTPARAGESAACPFPRILGCVCSPAPKQTEG